PSRPPRPARRGRRPGRPSPCRAAPRGSAGEQTPPPAAYAGGGCAELGRARRPAQPACRASGRRPTEVRGGFCPCPILEEIGGDTAAEACELSELRTGPSLAGAPAWERTAAAPARGPTTDSSLIDAPGGGALSIPDPGGDRGRNTSAAARELSELRSRFVDRSSSIDRCTVRPPRYSPSKGAALRARVSACKAQSGGVWRKLNAYVSICCWPLRGVEGCSLEARATEAARSQRSAVHCGERGRRARSSPSE
ncbi:unnamed protein product, partial [Prorocentrum cordatum]